MKRIFLVGLLVVASGLFFVRPAAAAECSDFDTQEEAQAFFDDANQDSLDGDGDGKACENLPSSDNGNGPSTDTATEDDGGVRCGDFPTREEAEEYIKDGGSLEHLDNDKDGRICDEELPHERGYRPEVGDDDFFDPPRGDRPPDFDDVNVHDPDDGIVDPLPTRAPSSPTSTGTATETNRLGGVSRKGDVDATNTLAKRQAEAASTDLRVLALVIAVIALGALLTLQPAKRSR